MDSKLRSLRSAGPSTKPEQFQGDRQSPKTRNGSHSRAEPEVRIQFPPAVSHANHRFLGVWCAMAFMMLLSAPAGGGGRGLRCVPNGCRSGLAGKTVSGPEIGHVSWIRLPSVRHAFS